MMVRVAPHITADLEIQSGVPVVEGTRIPVCTVAGYLRAGDSVDTVATELGITREKVLACRDYAEAHPSVFKQRPHRKVRRGRSGA